MRSASHYQCRFRLAWAESVGHPCGMYVRFKPSVSRARLQVSLVETKRTGSSVAAIHIAGLASVPGWWDAHDRFAFWTELAPRLAELEEAGILGPEDRAKVIASIDGRLPLPRRAEADAIASGFL